MIADATAALTGGGLSFCYAAAAVAAADSGSATVAKTAETIAAKFSYYLFC